MSAEAPTRVLLVEDDELLRPSLTSLLRLMGFDITAVGDALSFYAAFGSREFDCVVVDLGLPDQGGETLVDYLRRNTTLPIVVITARDTIETRVETYRAGADLFLAKPVDGRELAAAITSLVGRRRSEPSAPLTAPASWVLVSGERVLLSPDGVRIEFTAMEWRFLAAVAQQAPATLPRTDLLLALYGRDDESADHALDGIVRRTRQKITTATRATSPILTEYGVGYSFAGRVTVRNT